MKPSECDRSNAVLSRSTLCCAVQGSFGFTFVDATLECDHSNETSLGSILCYFIGGTSSI